MTDSTDYTPPAVWTWKQGNGGRFANINRPVAGATHEKALPVGCRLARTTTSPLLACQSSVRRLRAWRIPR